VDLSSAYNYRLDWIVSFVAVAREGGFSAAARAQYRSQSRISSHIGELERVLGTKLFDRSVHPAALTPEGRSLLPHAEEILARLHVFAEVVAEARGVVHGEVRVGMHPSAAAFLFPPLARQLQRDTPTVSAVLREGDTLALEHMLTQGEIDLAVRPVLPQVRDDKLVHRRLWTEPLVAVVPHGHPLAAEAYVLLKGVAQFPLVTIGESANTHRQFETNVAFAEAGVQPTIAFQTNQPQTLAALVRGGLGVGVTNALAMVTADCTGVELIPIAACPIDRHVAVWWHSERPPSTATTLVRDVISSLPPPELESATKAVLNSSFSEVFPTLAIGR
jgi:DNA-binding transcriptional LysR family regulator